MTAKLVIVEGPQRGREFPLREGENVVGRTSETPIELASNKVSRRHATIHLTNGRVEVEDLGSANGTFVNGKQVTRAPVPAGSKILVGDFVLQVVNGGGAARPAGAPARPVTGGVPAGPRTGPVAATRPVQGNAVKKTGKAVMVVNPQQRPGATKRPARAAAPVSVPSEGAKKAADRIVARIGGLPWRSQVVVIVVALSAALMLAVTYVISKAKSDYQKLATRHAVTIAKQIAAQNAIYLATKENLQLNVDVEETELGVKDAQIVGADGQIKYPKTLLGNLQEAPIVQEALALKDFSVVMKPSADNPEWVDIAVPVLFYNANSAKFDQVGAVLITYAPVEVTKRATQAGWLYGVSAFLLLVAGGAGAYLLMRSTESAVQRVQEDTELLARGDLQQIASPIKMREIEALVHSINRLFQKAGAMRSTADPASAAHPVASAPMLALPAQVGPVGNAGSDAIVRALVEAIEDAAIVVDADSKVVEVNKAAERMFGLVPAKVRGKHLLEAITEKQLLNDVLDLLNEIAAAPEGVVTRALEVPGPDGPKPGHVSAAGVRQGNELVGSAIVISARGDAS